MSLTVQYQLARLLMPVAACSAAFTLLDMLDREVDTGEKAGAAVEDEVEREEGSSRLEGGQARCRQMRTCKGRLRLWPACGDLCLHGEQGPVKDWSGGSASKTSATCSSVYSIV